MDQARPVTSTRLGHVERARHVRLHVALGGVVAVRDPDQGGQVEHGVATGDRLVDTAAVTHVAGQHLDRVAHVLIERVEPSPTAEGVVVHEGPHLGAVVDQSLDQVTPDEPLAAGHQHPSS